MFAGCDVHMTNDHGEVPLQIAVKIDNMVFELYKILADAYAPEEVQKVPV